MHGQSSLLASLALFLWVPICLWGMRRWPASRATAVLFFAAMLFLPEAVEYKLPGLPSFGKSWIGILWIFVGILLFHRERLKSISFAWQFKWCVGLLLTGAVLTVFLNTDSLTFGTTFVPSHTPYDAVHTTLTSFFALVLPFFVGATMFRSGSELRLFLRIFVGAALLYSVFQLIEMAMSPQFHRWVYGFHQHEFAQTMRGGGYRPMVFMGHGLAVAMFTSLATVAAAALYKTKVKVLGFSASWATGYLWAVLVASKSLAALLYSLASLPLVLFLSPKRQVWVAAILASILFVYPAARAVGLIPVDEINALVIEQFGVERAGSLTMRFENEAGMLDRAVERPWFGWGTYCRACLYDPQGNLISIRDGAWIKDFGDFGIFGFVGHFGLMLFPIFILLRRFRLVSSENDRRLLAAVALMIGWSAVDLIPNSDFNQLAMLLSGILYGSFAGILQETALVRRRKQAARIRAARRAREVPT